MEIDTAINLPCASDNFNSILFIPKLSESVQNSLERLSWVCFV